MTGRRSIRVPGLGHGANPIPTASRKGPLLATGGIRGVDAATGVQPTELVEEVRLAFANLETVVAAGGGSLEDVVHVTVFAGSDGVKPLLNEHWVKAFPDEDSRPARHVVSTELPAGMKVQLEVLAWIGEDS